ncbi:hypothetical protein MSAN_00768900 [Mycena sanguinolenta]|uniref:Uncharacterized protein n=1 Tax=Mycena sanguinolenta TaxID=230812 RepID=A0A8H6Z2B4_9AGAR|nr:hypothetical protein MSAN_00768900 [Mycena sanguinolenta]
MPGRPSLEFDNMTVKSASTSKRGWRGAVPRSPSTSSSSSRSTDESSNARSVVPGILAALAPAHEPGRRASPTPAEESWHRSRSPAPHSQRHLFVTTPAPPSPSTLSPYASHDPWALGRTSPSPSSNSGRSHTSTTPPEFLRRSPAPPRSPSALSTHAFHHAPGSPLHLNTSYSQSVSVPPAAQSPLSQSVSYVECHGHLRASHPHGAADADAHAHANPETLSRGFPAPQSQSQPSS